MREIVSLCVDYVEPDVEVQITPASPGAWIAGEQVDPDHGPSVEVIAVKAGGVDITALIETRKMKAIEQLALTAVMEAA